MECRPQDKIDWIRLAEYTESYTYAEIKNIVDLASRKAANKRTNITTDLLVDVILDNPPSLSDDDIENMRRF